MLCSRVHAMHAFGHAYADGFPYNTTYLFCSVSVFGHLKLCSRFCSCKIIGCINSCRISAILPGLVYIPSKSALSGQERAVFQT